MPRISVNVSDELAEFLEESAAAQKRSVSSQASIILDESPHFLGWKAMKKHAPLMAAKFEIDKDIFDLKAGVK